MELREIGIDDVYPDEKNPRKDFGDIAALAESCMLNALNPGEPVNPIVVVEDGGIYRIVDATRPCARTSSPAAMPSYATTWTRRTRWSPWWPRTTSAL